MSRFSPTIAATEGFRVMRREPWSVVVWTLLWMAALTVIALVKPPGGGNLTAAPTQRNLAELLKNFGPFGILLIAALLCVWVVTTTAAFRAVLRPDERKGFFLRLGADELRNAGISAVALFLVPLIGGVIASSLFLLFTPLLGTAPAVTRIIVVVGSTLTGGLGIWIGVRLSLIAAETFAERRFHLSAYWPLVRGRFWRLLLAYVIIAIMTAVFAMVLWFVGFILLSSMGPIEADADIVRRIMLFLLAGMVALFTALLFVIPSTLLCACQAYCFRALADDSPTVYGMSWAPDPDAHSTPGPI